MAYDITTKDGIVLTNIPDGMQPDAPELKQLVQQERQRRVQTSPEHAQRVAAQTAEDRKTYDPTVGMNWGEKAIANVGAGMDNLVTGARQLTGIGGKPSDADVREKRAIDEHLADQTSGGTALQIAGEVAPTLLIPAGGFVRGAQGAGKGAAFLTRTLAGQPARGAATAADQAIPRLGTGAAFADSAIAGGVSGALQPVTTDESRNFNTAVGAGAGAVLPLAVNAAKAGYGALTKRGAEGKAADALQRAIGDQPTVDAAVTTLRQPTAIPLSTATALVNANLGMAERTSRARDPANWLGFDQTQNRAAFGNVMDATKNADDIASLKAARSANWDTNKTAALGAVDPATFGNEVVNFAASMPGRKASPAGQNEMRPALTEIERQLDELGLGFTPDHAARLRSRMTESVRGPSTDPFATAPRSDPAYLSLRDDLDRMLDNSTGGKWQNVNAGYRADSVPVNQSQSSQAVRNAYVTPEGVPKRVELGDAPKVTQSNLQDAMARAGENRFGDQMAPQTRSMLTDTLAALQKRDSLQGLRGAGTAGGGSDTAMNLLADRLMPGDGVVPGVVNAISKFGKGKAQEALGEALRDPQQAISLLERKIAARQPLSPQEELLLNALRGGPSGAAPTMLAAPQAQ